MLNRYNTVDDVLSSDIFSRLVPPKPQGLDRVLKSTRLEDAIYGDLRSETDDALTALEQAELQKLSTFKGLSRDAFQSMYSLNPRRNDESELSTMARKFNSHIIDDMMNSDTYPTLKSLCEGRKLQSYEAAREFVENISGRLDELLQAAGGDKKSLDVLEKLESQQEQLVNDLNALAKQRQRNDAQSNPTLDEKITELANKAESKARQVVALNQMVDDNLRKNKGAIQSVVQAAAQSAQDKAQEVNNILMSWGDEAGDNTNSMELNKEVLEKVRGSANLMNIAKYLGRFREMLTALRKNFYAYGRGEKYSLELGNNLQRVITSEFAMLATPETVPLFLKRYQQKGLKQYQRREAVFKGSGDIIVCLDESDSTIGDPAAWGKALALSLLEIARINNRCFALIHFSGKGSFKTDVYPAGSYSFDDIVNTAETFLTGGTNYETPLREALRLMDGGFQNADVVFITDGECKLPEKFTEDFREAKTARKFTVTGLLLDMEEPGFQFSLEPFCERIYRTSEIMADNIAQSILSDRI